MPEMLPCCLDSKIGSNERTALLAEGVNRSAGYLRANFRKAASSSRRASRKRR
jgi:hypothetical protein